MHGNIPDKLIPKQMLLHAERPLGISLQFLPCNSSIQACTKSVGNHAKKSYLASEDRVKFSALAFASACAKFYETYMHDSLYSILHILTQLIQIFNIVFSDLLLCASRL